MSVLRTLSGPADLRDLSPPGLSALGAEIRGFLVAAVCRSGGHLGSNLGVVEITLAVHRVFDSPTDPVVFDTGHQAYAHKVVTGRAPLFGKLRQRDGLSGYPSSTESPHDMVSNSHASAALAYADGLAKAFELDGRPDRVVVAVVGDGALTGGLAWEALNNLGTSRRRVVVVLNDNGRSYAPTVGGVAAHLRELRAGRGSDYASLVELLGSHGMPTLPEPSPARSVQGGPPSVFEQLGLRYVGPVDGHDLHAVEHALRTARELTARGPVVVHCVTRKGNGFRPAEDDDVDHLHSVGVSDPATGRLAKPAGTSWTSVFADELLALARGRDDLVAVTAAMAHPTGLARMATEFPDRVFDVGIAEQHAVTSAAGLALGGRHPVVALYSTFLNRAFDQVLFDVALHEQPVTFVVDRAGITGPDGSSHHGMWDLAALGAVPGIRVAAPRDADRLREELREAVAVGDGPTAVRFPKATVAEPLPAVERTGGVDVLRVGARPDVLVVAVGVLAAPAVEAARRLAADGTECTVVDPRWVLPVAPRLVELAAEHELVVTVEDGVRLGGVGDAVACAVADAGLRVPVHALGLPTEFVPHGGRAELLASAGLDAEGVARAVAGKRDAADPIEHENFPVALKVLPADVREDLVAVYRYARYVDDVGDEATGDRQRALDAVDADLDTLFAGGTPALAAVRGLHPTVSRRSMPEGPFRRLVEANRRDQVVSRYATFDQLREYCRLSADPVGELVLHVFGVATPERVALSDRICTALQVVEHLQDVKEDYERDRVYLPKEEMDRFGVVEDDLAAEHASPALRQLLEFEARRAEELLGGGTPLLRTLSGWARVCVTGYVAGGRAALGALRRAGYDPLPGPPRAGRLHVLRAALALSLPGAAQ